jgi:hypothetical protein
MTWTAYDDTGDWTFSFPSTMESPSAPEHIARAETATRALQNGHLGSLDTSASAVPGYSERDDAERRWKRRSSDLKVPKLGGLGDAKDALAGPGPAGPKAGKRPRGRPRKHPVAPPIATNMTKGRSKTGCVTKEVR